MGGSVPSLTLLESKTNGDNKKQINSYFVFLIVFKHRSLLPELGKYYPSFSFSLPSCWPEPSVLLSVGTPCWAEQTNSCFHGASKFMGDQQRIIKQIRIYKIQRTMGEINQIQRQRITRNLLGKVVKEGSHSWCLMSKGGGVNWSWQNWSWLWRIRLLFKAHTHKNPSFKQ